MIHKFRHLFLFLIVYILLLSGGLLLLQNTDPEITTTTYANLLTIMTLITLMTYFLVFAGIRRGDKDPGIYLLAGMGGKFLAYLVLILIFWTVGKNFTKDFIIVFFVLYLVLTIFLLSVLFKKLKNN